MQTGNTLQGTILSIHGETEGFPIAQIGAVGAGFWAGVIIGSLSAAKVIRRVAERRRFRRKPGTDPEHLRHDGIVAGVTGQLLLPTTDPAGFRPLPIIACIISVALVPVALTQGAAPAPPGEGSHVGLRRLYRDSPLGVVAGFLSGVTTGAFFTLGPIFAEMRGLGMGEIAIFMACGMLGGFIAAWPLGWLSDRCDRRLVIVGAAGAAAVSLVAMMAVVPGDAYPWLLYLCVALFGGMIIPTYSLALAHFSDAVSQEEMVAASGGLLLAHGAGAAAGPLIAGFAMSATPRGLSYTLVAAQVLIALFGVWRLASRTVPLRRKSAFALEPPVPVGVELPATHSTLP